MRRALLALLLPLSAVSAMALRHDGYWGIVTPAFRSWAHAQVMTDLAVSLSLVMAWIWRDARARGRNPLPWAFATLAVGSFAPILYLLLRTAWDGREPGSPR